MPSEITGEKAARTKARSISLQTWIRPFWMTVKRDGIEVRYAGHCIACCATNGMRGPSAQSVGVPQRFPQADEPGRRRRPAGCRRSGFLVTTMLCSDPATVRGA